MGILIAAAASAVALSAAGGEPVTPTAKIVLFNGTDLAGWAPVLPGGADPKAVWSVKDGALRCEGKPNGYLRTEGTYTAYRLHVEWRWPEKPTNSGVLLNASGPDKVWPKSIEAQLMAGNAGDLYLFGGAGVTAGGQVKRGGLVKKQAEPSERPPGQWNAYDILCTPQAITLTVNGTLQNAVTQPSETAGFIALQSEGSPIEFRNIYLEPAGAAEAKPAAGPDFTLLDQRGNRVRLSDFADRIVVLEWVNFDCPFAKRHYQRGTFNRLAEKYRGKGVVWFAINSTHYATVATNKAGAETYGALYLILDDHAGDVGRLFGAKTTPDIRILKGGQVVYKGGIDDDPGGRKETPINYVDQALEELTAGKDVTAPETKPYGCSVKYAKGK
jgi:peroxiredoxin